MKKTLMTIILAVQALTAAVFQPYLTVWTRRWEGRGTYWIILMYVSTFIMSPSLQSFLKPSTSVFGFSRPSPAAWERNPPITLSANWTDNFIIYNFKKKKKKLRTTTTEILALLLLPGAGIATPASCHLQTQASKSLYTRVWWASAGSEPAHWLPPWSSVSCSPTYTHIERHTAINWQSRNYFS